MSEREANMTPKQVLDETLKNRTAEEDYNTTNWASRALNRTFRFLNWGERSDYAPIDELAHEYIAELRAIHEIALMEDSYGSWNEWVNAKDPQVSSEAKWEAYMKIVNPTVNHIIRETIDQCTIFANEAVQALSQPPEKRLPAVVILEDYYAECAAQTRAEPHHWTADQAAEVSGLEIAFDREYERDKRAREPARLAQIHRHKTDPSDENIHDSKSGLLAPSHHRQNRTHHHKSIP